MLCNVSDARSMAIFTAGPRLTRRTRTNQNGLVIKVSRFVSDAELHAKTQP